MHVVDAEGVPVAMGRVIGDGGWYFHVADIATDPGHQRRGLGRAVVEWLVADIRSRAPEGAYVTLVGTPRAAAVPVARVRGRRAEPGDGVALR